MDKTVFNKAFNNSLAHEGGFVNDPADSGGATKYGITLKTYREKHPEATIDAIKNLTVKDAEDFYFKEFWLRYGYDRITIEDLAVKIFDAAINMGAQQAHICLQRALNCVGFKLVEDGHIGEQTLNALNHGGNPEWQFAILCAYRSELAGFYRLLAEKKSQNKKFLNGWLKKRAYS